MVIWSKCDKFAEVSAKGVSDSLSTSAVKSKLEKDELTGIQKEKASVLYADSESIQNV